MPKKIIPTEKELEIIKSMNDKRYSYKEIANKIDCGYQSLKRIMDEYHIEKKRYSLKNHLLQEDFFEKIDTEEKAYLLGLLKTDGYVKNSKTLRGSKKWGITLKATDCCLLEQIKTIIGSDVMLTKDCRIGKECYSLEITNEKMCSDLSKYEIIPRKTYFLDDIHLEQIPIHLQCHYLRGLLDGDGSIFVEKENRQLGISFCGYNENFVYSFQIAIDNFLNKEKHNKIFKVNAYQCKWKGNKICKKILDYLYSNSTIFLPRKKEFYLNSLNNK